ncbi:MAG TPA: integrase core domain-containing protein, partial [Planctomycetaceae bacterium]|nr:integrase core domain-containing protein [Planctomycetaceae bacterium]
RILGELRRLGFTRICRETVRRIIREEGIEPSPRRSQSTWDQFVTSHAETLWGCDFFSVKSLTKKGIVHLYLMVFVHLDSRKAIVSPATLHPDSAWVTKQTRSFLAEVPRGEGKKLYLVRDRDTKFSKQFHEALLTQNVKPIRMPIASPNMNGRVERFIKTLKYECLNQFILFGQKHVDYLVDEFVDYYNRERAHSAIGYRPPARDDPPEANEDASLDGIVRRDRLGGIVKYYERRAA